MTESISVGCFPVLSSISANRLIRSTDGISIMLAILRVCSGHPDTKNFKASDKLQCRITESSEARYVPSDFEAYILILSYILSPENHKKPTSGLLSGCSDFVSTPSSRKPIWTTFIAKKIPLPKQRVNTYTYSSGVIIYDAFFSVMIMEGFLTLTVIGWAVLVTGVVIFCS